MKTLYIEAKYEKQVTVPKKIIEKLEKKIAIFTTLQFIDSLPGIKR